MYPILQGCRKIIGRRTAAAPVRSRYAHRYCIIVTGLSSPHRDRAGYIITAHRSSVVVNNNKIILIYVYLYYRYIIKYLRVYLRIVWYYGIGNTIIMYRYVTLRCQPWPFVTRRYIEQGSPTYGPSSFSNWPANPKWCFETITMVFKLIISHLKKIIYWVTNNTGILHLFLRVLFWTTILKYNKNTIIKRSENNIFVPFRLNFPSVHH